MDERGMWRRQRLRIDWTTAKRAGAADWCHRQEVKQNLSPHFGVFGIFEGVSCTAK
jgi:hypothetical protein